ncbi:hypothetical protein Hanom_Chr12g01089251 [Helianthus anomalus]
MVFLEPGVSLEAASLSPGIEVRLAYILPSPDPINSFALGGIILGMVVVVVVVVVVHSQVWHQSGVVRLCLSKIWANSASNTRWGDCLDQAQVVKHLSPGACTFRHQNWTKEYLKAGNE